MAVADIVYLSDKIASGAIAKIIDRTLISPTDTGLEYRTSPDTFRPRAWQISWGQDPDDVDEVETLYEVNGREHSFLFFAPRLRDHVATNQFIGTGDGTTAAFQLRIIRTTGVRSATKNTLHPKSGTLVVRVAGVTKTETTHYTVNYSTGIVTFTAGNIPAAAADVRADFHYYTAVRFESSELLTTVIVKGEVGVDPVQQIRSATIVEALNE